MSLDLISLCGRLFLSLFVIIRPSARSYSFRFGVRFCLVKL